MSKVKLIAAFSGEKLAELGFKEQNNHPGDPRGFEWVIENDLFRLSVNCWLDVELSRKDDRAEFIDPIQLKIESIDDLKSAIFFIESEGAIHEGVITPSDLAETLEYLLNGLSTDHQETISNAIMNAGTILENWKQQFKYRQHIENQKTMQPTLYAIHIKKYQESS